RRWGPQQTSLDDDYWFSGRGGPWGVVRIVTDISGDWLLYGRCQDQTTDAFSLTLTFVSEEDQDVTASGSGTDYDGDPLFVVLEGTYLQDTNTLSADINFSFPDTGGSRIDTFERRLNEDDTGYFPATLVYHSTNGCDLAVRLVNQETAPPPARQSASSPSGGTGLISD